MLLDNWLAQRAFTSPDRTALIADGAELTYAELEEAATGAARRLAGLGVRQGSVVRLTMPAGIDYAVLLHAVMKLGAIALPTDPRLTAAERAAGGDTAAIEITGPGDAGSHEADLPLLGELDLDTVYCRILTSGTAGKPRPVDLTYGNHLWSAVGSAFNLGVDPNDRWLCCLPLFHVSGLSILLRSAIYGTSVVLHEGFDLDRVAESLERDGVTVVSLVSTMLTRLVDAGAAIERPRAILVGGGPVSDEILVEAMGLGATVAQTYGLTEAASQVTTLSPAEAEDETKRGSAGRPLLTTHVRIMDGEILVQGPTVAPGMADVDGWLHTGDSGRIDDEGFLWVEGRRDEVIVTGGENVAPREIEEVLAGHPEVADAAVVGRPDPDWQNAVVAIVVPREGTEPASEALRDWCRERLAAFKVPKSIELIDELPRTASGKLLRRELVQPQPERG